MIGLETITERRERLLAEHARANAAKARRDFWQHKAEGGLYPTPTQALAGK